MPPDFGGIEMKKNENNPLLISGLAIATIALVVLSILIIDRIDDTQSSKTIKPNTPSAELEAYAPRINPSEFSSDITNPYFSMPIGKKMVYEAETEDGIERIETIIPGWKKTIMGVETLVFWDRVYLDGELIEDTRDYIAQDTEGNVWYFGENVDNYADGYFLDNHGAWIGGIDGAQPGIWMPAVFTPGNEYRQEFYKGEAEDMAKVEATGLTVKTPSGTYNDCVKILEWTPLESGTAYKYHCRGAGGTVLEEEEDEKVVLIEVGTEECIELPNRYASEGVVEGTTAECGTMKESDVQEEVKEIQKDITEQEARKIALDAVPGTVTDIGIEKKFGKAAYVVEVDPYSGPETDVIIDIRTGKVLLIED